MSGPVQSFTLVDVPGGTRFSVTCRHSKRARWKRWRVGGVNTATHFCFRLGPKVIYLLSHPDLAEAILVHHADRFPQSV